jgi:hypothetical protein
MWSFPGLRRWPKLDNIKGGVGRLQAGDLPRQPLLLDDHAVSGNEDGVGQEDGHAADVPGARRLSCAGLQWRCKGWGQSGAVARWRNVSSSSTVVSRTAGLNAGKSLDMLVTNRNKSGQRGRGNITYIKKFLTVV